MSLLSIATSARAQFVHPGCLSTQADLNRMATKVAASQEPWKGSWDILVGNEWYYMAGPEAVATVYVDAGGAGADNYMRLARDSHRAYQCALRYHGSGNTAYADKAVTIMNAWAATHTAWNGNSNVSLRQGLYGYAFACAAELMRNYSGWNASDFSAFKTYMIAQFYGGNSWFLNNHYGRCKSHYWANWNLSNMTSMLAIGVLCDDQAIYDEALDHFYNGIHTGAITNAIHEIHLNGMGQWQEMGRDQGHSLIGPQLMGAFCEIAWNQGLDLYGHLGNRFLATVEHVSKYNTWHDVPYVSYSNCNYGVWPEGYRFTQNVIGSYGRGQLRPGWDLIYNHYVNRKGMAAPWTNEYAEQVRPEGGGMNYGSTSGGFDSLGFTTLTHSLDPATGIAPSLLLPSVKGGKLTLSWQGTARALSYYVKRSTTSGGPYTTIATVSAEGLSYIDTGLAPGTTYYYVVSANAPGGETANSAEVSASHDGQLYGTIIGTAGSWGDYGAVKELALDGSLRNFIDIHESTGGWIGLDLGAGVSAVITGFKYCPRTGFVDRMVGGKVQGSNTADFSSGVVDLFTIATAPPEGVLTSQSISNGNSFRYVRYIQTDGGYNTAAEVQFIGTVTGLSAPSSAPGGLVATRNGYDSVDLTWNAVTGATDYLIKRSTTSGGPYAVVDSVTGTTYGDRKLAPGNHYYVVSALNSVGESANSAEQGVNLVTGGHYKFDGNTNNENGVFHGTATGSPVYGTGQYGSAIDLDGVDDHVTIPAGAADFTDITLATWVNWDGSNDWQRIFDFGDNTSAYMFLTPKTGTSMRFAIKNGGSEQQLNTASLAIGQWTHLAVTLNGNTGTLYVNGTAVATNNAMTINPKDFTPAVNYIGKSQWPDPLFNGRIDDFRIYGSALTASEINDIKNNNPPPGTNPPAAPIGLNATAVSTSRIELSWTASSGATSYNVKRSTTSGGPYMTIATGVASTSYNDTGLSSSTTYYYVVSAVNAGGESANSAQGNPAPAAPANLIATAVSISQIDLAWSAVSGADTYTVRWSPDPGGPYTVLASGVAGTTHSDTDVLAGSTVHYVVTANNFGGESPNSNEASASTPDLVAHLPFDENSGITASDQSPNGFDATLANGPLWSTGILANAVAFDGTDDHLTLPAGIVSHAGDFTIATWVRLDTLADWQRIFDFGTGTGVNMFLTPRSGSGTVRFAITASGGGGEERIDGPGPLPTGAWTHVAVTLTGGVGTLYVDGVAVGTNSSMSLEPASLGVTTQNYIGRSQYPDPYLDGTVDDFRINGRALTGTEIAELHAAGIANNWTELVYDDFETGLGNYTDGGNDCFHSNSSYSPQGSHSMNIQDNSGTASAFWLTNGIDVATPGYTQIRVEFSFQAVSMEAGEDFWLQYFDGSSWQTVEAYAEGSGFQNNVVYDVAVEIDEASHTFPSNMQIRFVCDASGNGDDVYIDEIRVSAK